MLSRGFSVVAELLFSLHVRNLTSSVYYRPRCFLKLVEILVIWDIWGGFWLFRCTCAKTQHLFLTLYSAEAIIVPRRIIWSWYNGRWWVGCYIWYSEEGTGRGRSPPRPLLAVPNVTAQPSTASVPIIVLLFNGPLLCGSNVRINRLKLLSPPLEDALCYFAQFLPRNVVHKRGICRHALSDRMSVGLSVTFMDPVETNKRIFNFFTIE